ncbi:hypothetical protein ABI59_05710 [Acidobacteria bacterium Mor1]|nr:hypothetical protein ABI59_05710 [Acidobacteria bacterium Mor1]
MKNEEHNERYRSAMAEGKAKTLEGDFACALECYRSAREAGGAMDSSESVDRAELNMAMVRLQMGQAKRGEEGLREILLRARNQRIAFSAAYNLASSLRKQGHYERALGYARRAMDRAAELEAHDLQAGVHTLTGNILLNQSYPDDALVEYETAWRLHHEAGRPSLYSLAILKENIGYCLLLMDRLPEGMQRLNEALDLAEEAGDRRCQAECLQDLCYGHLLLEEYEEAILMGERALRRAVSSDYPDIEENCHYLLGELGNRIEDPDLRDAHFDRLQELHPELPMLKEFLCSVDVASIITLKR